MTPTTYQQPREGITGTDRNNYLLSLDDAAIAHRDALIATAHLLRTACQVGDPAPIVTELWQRLRNPVPGDLVVEVSVLFGRADVDRRLKGLGILIERRVEWWETDEDWAANLAATRAVVGGDFDEERTTDEAWYIQYGNDPGDVCRWVNCDFMAIPTDVAARWDRP